MVCASRCSRARARPTAKGDALRALESVGLHVKEWSRERVLGGASTTWAGLSSPLDPIDFEARAFAGSDGWPIARDELLPFYAEAARNHRFPALADFGPAGFAKLRAKGELQPTWSKLEEKVFLARSEPQDFGRECAAAWNAPEVDLFLDATVVELETRAPEAADTRRKDGAQERASGGALPRVCAARVRTSRGELRVRARAFVLATGGVENARLLLVSRDACPAGLGNEHGRVGLGFMNHPKNYFGIVELTRPVMSAPYFFGSLHAGFAGYAGLRLKEDVQRELGLLNSYARFEPLFPWSDDEGVESLVTLVKRSRGAFARWKKGKEGEVVELRDWSETGDDSELQSRRGGTVGLLANVALHAPSVAQYAWFRVGKRRPRVKRVRVRNFVEMQPSSANRVTLSDRVDAHGVPLARVAHACTELDRRSLVELHRVLRAELEANGIGRLEGDLAGAEPWPIDQDASHHLGATRMGRDPRASVVDADLRLHGAANLWIAGGSVFPTAGCANPTWTIAALSLRLARHLAGVLGRGGAA
ncbi:MAG: GMC family oxidoreductase [Planctomycetes bacterium]|nr:GMC family oxidoreductase [Planctomycetota bacterium]